VVLASRNEFLSRPGLTGLGGVQQLAKKRKLAETAGVRPKEA